MGVLTLNDLIPDIQHSFDVLAREQVGFIPAVSRDSTAERAAVGQDVVSPVVGEMPAEDLSVGATAADTPNQTIDNVKIAITKSRSVPFGITGEENLGLSNAGTLGTIQQQRIAQAMRTLTNEIEADLATSHLEASRSYGTATGTPFGTAGDLTDFSNPMGILNANGAPIMDNQMVLGNTAVNRLRGNQATLFQVNTSGSDELLRTGSISALPVMGFDLHHSQAVAQSIAGTGASATTDATGYAIGETVITLASAGTGTIVAGDIISFAGDPNNYVVASGDTDVSDGGSITIAEPGLLVAMGVGAVAITIVAATTRNMAFHRSAIQLATRSPAMPDGGDCADDVLVLTDPYSGIAYEFAIYRQKRQVRYEINLSWGFKVTKPSFCGVLIGA